MQYELELSNEWSRGDIGLPQRAAPSESLEQLWQLPYWSSCQVTTWVSSVTGFLASCGAVASMQLFCKLSAFA